MDTRLQRHVKDARQAYAEGHVDRAIEEYRKALRRAWAMDDPYESGTAAYNLAACLISDARFQEARDWLLDARVELQRADVSAGNVWLLEAKIASQESRFEDVHEFLQRASCSEPPCTEEAEACGCFADDPCCDHGVSRIPCLGEKHQQRQAAKDCERAYRAQIHLVRARAAAEQYDIATAQQHWTCATQLVADICSDDLRAELENVAALIHIAKGEYLQAGRHLDREADYLRRAGNYREIPTALELASAAYEQAGLTGLAAERLCRVARVLFGRGDVHLSWRYVQLASPMAQASASEATQVRLSLLANEILLVLSEQGESPSNVKLEPEQNMMAPAEDSSAIESLEPPA